MRIALCGYGKMGREIERVAKTGGHEITGRIDPHDTDADATEVTRDTIGDAEVVIEFSHADAVVDNVGRYADLGIQAIVGTTGWLGRLAEVRSVVEASDIGLLYGSNFSIGAHLFFGLVARVSRALSAFDEYDLAIVEHHHAAKVDAPSGTALSLAEVVLDNHSRKSRITTEVSDRRIDPDELHVASVRAGSQPGEHRLIVDGPADTIELTHRARSRGGFAAGAVRAAEWLGLRTGLFTVEELIADLTGGAD